MEPDAGLTLSELVRLVGDEHVLVEPVADHLLGARVRKGGLTELRLLTSATNCNEIACGGPAKVGLLIWLPRKRVEAAMAEWRQGRAALEARKEG